MNEVGGCSCSYSALMTFDLGCERKLLWKSAVWVALISGLLHLRLYWGLLHPDWTSRAMLVTEDSSMTFSCSAVCGRNQISLQPQVFFKTTDALLVRNVFNKTLHILVTHEQLASFSSRWCRRFWLKMCRNTQNICVDLLQCLHSNRLVLDCLYSQTQICALIHIFPCLQGIRDFIWFNCNTLLNQLPSTVPDDNTNDNKKQIRHLIPTKMSHFITRSFALP